MGRHKTRDKHLPMHMHRKGQNYYYVARVLGKYKWTALGNDFTRALLLWRDMEGKSEGAATVALLLDNALVAMAQKLKPRSLQEHTRAAARVKKAFEGFRPHEVQPFHIAQYLETREAKVSANREIAFFSAAWDVARRRGWINLPNPTLGIKRNPEKARKRTASQDEIKALLFGPDGQRRDCVEADMVELSLTLALRASDLLSLKVQQVDLKRNPKGILIKPQKTDRSSEAEVLVMWTPALRQLVSRILSRPRRRVTSIYLFHSGRGRTKGQPFSLNSFESKYHRYFKRCGVSGLTWHDLRRTALNMRHRESGTEAAKALAAHASITTTEGYLAQVGPAEVLPVSLGY